MKKLQTDDMKIMLFIIRKVFLVMFCEELPEQPARDNISEKSSSFKVFQ
jgi:hypothetical protein